MHSAPSVAAEGSKANGANAASSTTTPAGANTAAAASSSSVAQQQPLFVGSEAVIDSFLFCRARVSFNYARRNWWLSKQSNKRQFNRLSLSL
jgi:hypothetical protein